MEKLPPHPGAAPVVCAVPTALEPACDPDDWRLGLPTLTGSMVTLREVGTSDAHALYAALTTTDASRFAPPPPPTVDGFERFIEAAQRRRAAGDYACFAVVPHNSEPAVGWFQVRSLEPGFKTAEWDFAFAVEYWGSDVFVDGARLMLDFVFAAIGANRLEARVAVENGRGNGALRKTAPCAKASCGTLSLTKGHTTTSGCGRFFSRNGTKRDPSHQRSSTKRAPTAHRS
jgi:RimJ/RimL family protein N-acetyltransferase